MYKSHITLSVKCVILLPYDEWQKYNIILGRSRINEGENCN